MRRVVQRGLAERNANVAEDQRIYVRIGINLGEVIVEGDDRLGEGVNIAARLEQLAEPGGICVSGKVTKEVEKKLAFAFEPMGEQKVKNITEPIPVYKVKLEGPKVRPRPRRSRKTPFGVLAASTIAILLIWCLALSRSLGADAQGAAEVPAAGLPKGPGVAVLPFLNLSGDPNQEYFSDGLTEDILTELSRAPDLACSPATRPSNKGEASGRLQTRARTRRALCARGQHRRAGDDLRITAQLIDAETGAHVWADKFDRKMADVFLVQDEIVADRRKDRRRKGCYREHRGQSAVGKTPEQIQAYDSFFARTTR